MTEIDELARQERNLYMREWCAKNKEKRKEAQARYWRKKAEKRAAEKTAEQKEAAHE